ncbi:MAG: site-specific integrase [Synergistaceae bacterium]|nr:site-specific integrase [Synergistaceae bacterium]
MALTQVIINKIKPTQKIEMHWDDGSGGVSNLAIKIRPTGKRSWHLYYKNPTDGKERQDKIAPGTIPLQRAREIAVLWNGEIARGKDPRNVMKPQQAAPPAAVIKDPTLGEIRAAYEAWLLPDDGGEPPLKSGKTTLRTIDSFKAYYQIPLSQFTVAEIRDWIANCRARNNKGISINRRIATLQAMLSWAKREGLISQDYRFPRIAKQATTDSDVKIRYLHDDERKRLYAALKEREQKQGKDYLKIAVIIANYSGIRRGALLGLRWGDIKTLLDGSQSIHLSPRAAKSKKSYDLPLSNTVIKALEEWRVYSEQTWGAIKPDDYIIRYGKAGTPITDLKHAWHSILKEANIQNFRWHDLRHDFASQLVMKGSDLYMVQRLLTHESIQMTQRYAHLAPKEQQAAVNKLNDLLPNQ